MPENTETEKVFQLGLLQGNAHRESNGVPYVLVPESAQVVSIEQLLPAPVRRRATVTCDELDSFTLYVNEFGEEGHTRIFAGRPESPSLLAILDYHGVDADEARWNEHRATFAPRPTEEWKRWCSIANQRISQADFARFLEDNILNVMEPDGASLLEIAHSLNAKKDVEFHSTVNLNNGTSALRYVETMTTTGGNGEVVVPNALVLGLPIYQGGENYKVNARLRFCLDEREVFFTVEIPNRHLILERIWKELVAKVEKDTSSTVIRGGLSSGVTAPAQTANTGTIANSLGGIAASMWATR